MMNCERISILSNSLYQASKHIRILTHIAWPAEVQDIFFKQKAQQLPKVEYKPYDSSELLGQLDSITKDLDEAPVDLWLKKQTDTLATSARMMGACGTAAFYDYSRQLYGAPLDSTIDVVKSAKG